MKTKVWTISIRIFHWLLVIGFISAYVLSDFDNSENFHYAFGLFVGALVLFRIIYGLIGNKYAHFKDFPISVKKQISFLKHFFHKDKTYIGHNPAASIVMLCIFIAALLCSISGFMLYSVENPSIFKSGLSEYFLKEAHEIFANSFLVLAIIHLLGVFADLLFHSGSKTLQSIFTGYKTVNGENSKQNTLQTIFSILWFVVPFLAFVYGNNLKVVGHSKEFNTEQDEKYENLYEDDD